MSAGGDPTFDAYSPAEIADRIERAGCAKARLGLIPMFTLAVLAGAFIALGASLFLVATTDTQMGYGPTRLLGGLAFSLGLVLVVVAGAELFTGNNLIVMARCDGMIGTTDLLRNWIVVYAGNFVGALATAQFVVWSGLLDAADGAVGANAHRIASAKGALALDEAFVRGILCNVLVCLAVWLSFAARDVTGKAVAIAFPITAFVALGFEHSIANMFFLPLSMLSGGGPSFAAAAANIAAVTAGNILGGSVLVAVVYWLVYCRERRSG